MREQTASGCKVWVACVLSLITPPLGHFYVGRMQRGGLLWLVWQVLTLGMISVLLYTGVSGLGSMAALAAVFALFYLGIAVDAARLAARASVNRTCQRTWALLLLWLGLVVLTNLLAHGLRITWFEAFAVPTDGMGPAVVAGDRVLAEKLRFDPRRVRRGDIVMFRPPHAPDAVFIGRVIGLPGETIELRDNAVFIDGQPLEEPYAYLDERREDIPMMQLSNFEPDRIADGHAFMMGDNRFTSADSRLWGTLPMDRMFARVKLVYWSRSLPRNDPWGRVPADAEPSGIRWDRIGHRLD